MKKTKRPFGRYTPIQYCDKLWSIIIRAPGRCCAKEKLVNGKVHRCSGALQAMHIEGRTCWELRHKLFNGLPGCQGVHTYFTYRNGEWEGFVGENYPEQYGQVYPISKHMRRGAVIDYYARADVLRAQLRLTELGHTYSKEDQRIIEALSL